MIAWQFWNGNFSCSLLVRSRIGAVPCGDDIVQQLLHFFMCPCYCSWRKFKPGLFSGWNLLFERRAIAAKRRSHISCFCSVDETPVPTEAKDERVAIGLGHVALCYG